MTTSEGTTISRRQMEALHRTVGLSIRVGGRMSLSNEEALTAEEMLDLEARLRSVVAPQLLPPADLSLGVAAKG